ncbi:MAG TPA: RNB domain-containing ribonuclease [Marmoricola sp.]|nr:RNB domain-containing ribonuclease [Marmoricola sp.]
MANRVIRVRSVGGGVGERLLHRGIAAIQAEQHVTPGFPAEVVAAAEKAARRPRLPELDRTDLPLVTVDPPGSMDLDQAMHLARDGDGFVVHYAIADLAAFISPGDPLDLEAHRRGESLYGADSLVPLHPRELSEGAASLLPDQERPSFLWTIRLAADGAVTDARVERARVRSRERLDYEGLQRSGGELFDLLEEIGRLRIGQEEARGGVSLPMPEQQVEVEDGVARLEFREVLPVEEWNAQISLLTGFAAARLMVAAKVGILRTLPPPEDRVVQRLRRTARGLGVDWSPDVDYPEFIRGLDSAKPQEAAMVVACTALLRGAGYAGFDGSVPEQPEHAALAAPYAHVTAPLRRLVDRYGLECCAAICAGEPVPEWVRSRLGELPGTMQESGRRAHAYENAVLDLVEAQTLHGRVGDAFRGVVVELDGEERTRGEVVVRDPAVEARATTDRPGGLPLGEEVVLTLAEADPATRTVRFHYH